MREGKKKVEETEETLRHMANKQLYKWLIYVQFKFTSKSDSLVGPFNLGPSHLLPLTHPHISCHCFRQHPFAPSHSASQNPGSERNRVKRYTSHSFYFSLSFLVFSVFSRFSFSFLLPNLDLFGFECHTYSVLYVFLLLKFLSANFDCSESLFW